MRWLTTKKAQPSKPARLSRYHWQRVGLLEHDRAKHTIYVVVGPRGEEQFICRSIVCHRQPVAEINCPKLIDVDDPAACVPYSANRGSGNGIEGVDGAAVGVIRHQQCVAQRPEAASSCGESPGLIQRRALRQGLQEYTTFAEYVDAPPSPPDEIAKATYSSPSRSRMPNTENPAGTLGSVNDFTCLKLPSYTSTRLCALSAA